MTRRCPPAAPPTAPALSLPRAVSAVAVVAALLLQILVPALAAPVLRNGDWWASAGGIGDVLCIGRPGPSASDGGSDAPGLPVDGQTEGGHGCCVLCTTPGLATVMVPVVGPAPAWHRVAAEVPRRQTDAVAPERSPIRPRAPPAA